MPVDGKSRNDDSRSTHWSSSCRRWTRTSALTPRSAMSQAAMTVFPNAVVADSTPVSCASIACAAIFCSGRSSPRNVAGRGTLGSAHHGRPERSSGPKALPSDHRSIPAEGRCAVDDPRRRQRSAACHTSAAALPAPCRTQDSVRRPAGATGFGARGKHCCRARAIASVTVAR